MISIFHLMWIIPVSASLGALFLALIVAVHNGEKNSSMWKENPDDKE